MTQNRNQLIQLFVGNVYNAIVHNILEKAIDKVELKWITYEYKDLFLKYSSSSDNGTWNKGRSFNEAKIRIIPLEHQKKIVAYYDRFNQIKKYLIVNLERIENLMDKEFCIT